MMVMYAYLDVSKAAVRGTNAVMSLVQVGGWPWSTHHSCSTTASSVAAPAAGGGVALAMQRLSMQQLAGLDGQPGHGLAQAPAV